LTFIFAHGFCDLSVLDEWARRKQGTSENEALDKTLQEKSAEFVEKAEVYAKG
jgi:hypothetical protein